MQRRCTVLLLCFLAFSSLPRTQCQLDGACTERRGHEDDEDEDVDEIEIEIPRDAPLYAAPGSVHTQAFPVTNHGPASRAVVSHREKFASAGGLHAEIVRRTSPAEIGRFGFNETRDVEVVFDVPEYVAAGAQFKVTLVVQKVGFSYRTWERSFYFTASHLPLSHYDALPPECGQPVVCPDYARCWPPVGGADGATPTATPPPNCNDTTWTAELLVRDNLTGLRDIDVLGEEEAEADDVRLSLARPLVVGSVRHAHLRLEVKCCRPGVVVQLTDVTGQNGAACAVGQVSGAGRSEIELLLTLTLLLLAAALNLCDAFSRPPSLLT